MALYDFTLRFTVDADGWDIDAIEKAIFGSGCDDVMLGLGRRGSIVAGFVREANSAAEAVRNGRDDILKALPGARLVESAPDIVSLSDLAEVVGRTRQNMRQYAAGEIQLPAPFPAPFHDGPQPLWRLHVALSWFRDHAPSVPVPPVALELSRATYALNIETEMRRTEV